MTFIEKIRIIERIDQLIRLKATGSAKELAIRLNISRSTVYELIACIRSLGAEVKYCRKRKSLYYLDDKTFLVGFVDLKKIKGGESIVYPKFSDIVNLYSILKHETYDFTL